MRPARRRVPALPVVVLVVLVGLGTMLGYGIGRGVTWVRDAWPDPVPPLLADKGAVPQPADVGGPSRPCPASSLTLAAVPGATTVQPGQGVSFDVSVTNSGRRPCLVNGGDASRQLVITDASGATVWSSAHCAAALPDLLLGPENVRQDTLRWTGSRSVAGSCTTGQEQVPPGKYEAQVVMPTVAGATSTPVTITVEAPPEPTPSPDATSVDPTPSHEDQESDTTEDAATEDDATPPADDAAASGSAD